MITEASFAFRNNQVRCLSNACQLWFVITPVCSCWCRLCVLYSALILENLVYLIILQFTWMMHLEVDKTFPLLENRFSYIDATRIAIRSPCQQFSQFITMYKRCLATWIPEQNKRAGAWTTSTREEIRFSSPGFEQSLLPSYSVICLLFYNPCIKSSTNCNLYNW